MSRVSRVFSTLVLVVATAASVDATPPGGRERLLLDRGWRFALGHASDPVAGLRTRHRLLLLPRQDRLRRRPREPALRRPRLAPGRPAARLGGGAALRSQGQPQPRLQGRRAAASRRRSVGWYRRTFFVPERRSRAAHPDRVRRRLPRRPGLRERLPGRRRAERLPRRCATTSPSTSTTAATTSSPCAWTPRMEEGWFYEGAGIYRHVWLLEDGAAARRPPRRLACARTVDGDDATLLVETTRRQRRARGRRRSTRADGPRPTTARPSPTAEPAAELTLARGSHARVFHGRCRVAQPRLWSLETPAPATRSSRRRAPRRQRRRPLRDDRSASARSASIPNEGFFLNGKHVQAQGHQQPPGPRRRRRGRSRTRCRSSASGG